MQQNHKYSRTLNYTFDTISLRYMKLVYSKMFTVNDKFKFAANVH